MNIRKATASDIDQIVKIKPIILKEIIAKRLEIQDKNEAEFLVIDNDGELVGFAFLKWHGKPTHTEYPDIEDLYIKGNQRGKGYGKAMLTECEKRAKEKGYKKIGLASNPDDRCAEKKLYLKMGYKHDGKSEYIDGVYNDVEDVVIDMEKEL